MKEAEFEGKSVEEALLAASHELGVNISEMTYEVLEVESGLFGLFGKSVKIRVRIPDDAGNVVFRKDYTPGLGDTGLRDDAGQRPPREKFALEPGDELEIEPALAPEPPRREERGPEHRHGEPRRDDRPRRDEPRHDRRPEQQRSEPRHEQRPEGRRDDRRDDRREPRHDDRRDDRPRGQEPRREEPRREERRPAATATGPKGPQARETLLALLQHLGVEAEVTVLESAEEVLLNVRGDDTDTFVGKDGETLAALQFLVNKIVNRFPEDRKLVVLDAEGFRNKREEQLGALARELAEKVIASGKVVRLSPMSAPDRRLIHLALRDHPKISTRSEGQGNFRCLLILPRGFPVIEGRPDREYRDRDDRGGFRGDRGPRGPGR